MENGSSSAVFHPMSRSGSISGGLPLPRLTLANPPVNQPNQSQGATPDRNSNKRGAPDPDDLTTSASKKARHAKTHTVGFADVVSLFMLIRRLPVKARSRPPETDMSLVPISPYGEKRRAVQDATGKGSAVKLISSLSNLEKDTQGEEETTPKDYEAEEPQRRKSAWNLRRVAMDMYLQNKVLNIWNKKEMCNVCDGLNLTIDKFIVQENSSDRNQQAYQTYFPSQTPSREAVASLRSGSHSFRLGTFTEIMDRSRSCPFCSLVINSLRVFDDLEEAQADGSACCDARWQVDGREVQRNCEGVVTSWQTRTRRIHLRWDNCKLQDSYLVLVAPEVLYRLNSNQPSQPFTGALFLGRNIDSAGNNQVLVKQWLDNCHEHHGEICKIGRNEAFEEMISKSYFGVIDVHEMRLTPLPAQRRYIALSYMWGDGTHYRTLRDNVQRHRDFGGLEKVFQKLPRSLQDTIRLVRSLGERYLWVDSLCIVQDSTRSWSLNSAVMDLVYGNAHLTICAADGDGANSGLKGINPDARRVSQYIEECGSNVRLMVSHLAETYIKKSRWSTRAWTFQERLLSKRCLIFVDGRVFFQCRSTAMSEDINAEQRSPGWSIELVQAPLQMLHEMNSRGFWVYMHCIKLYTARNLGRPRDVMAAFAGMANLLGSKMGAPLVFGLPSAYFDLALLWEPTSAAKRRVPKNKDEERDYDGRKFPSWSWCGWTESTMLYDDAMVGACLPNVHQWLREHTWIKWYVRDGHGNLRPIWSGSNYIGGDDRWKGYGSLTDSKDPQDSYGRRVRDEIDTASQSIFYRTLPEYPFRVSLADADFGASQLPDQCFLQFWTWSAFLRVFPVETAAGAESIGEGRRRYNIADFTQDWCGTIVLDEDWGRRWEPGKEHEFIAISDAKEFTREENDVWTYYIPKENGHSEWNLYNVILLEYKGETAHRIGLGKVFKEAFSNSCLPGKRWKEIILA